jgi:transposase
LRTFFATFNDKEEFYSEYLFRKLRLNRYINKQKSESKFLKEFSDQFGSSESTDVFIGDWDSSRHTFKGQTVTKGIGFRKMFRKYGYKVYLVDEYKTSKTCPLCF